MAPRAPRSDGGLPKKNLNVALKALKRLEAIDKRLDEEATADQKLIVFEARRTIMEVMMRPQRWSQMRLAAAAALLDEVCGKLTDKLESKEHQTIEVIINQKEKQEPL